jgi:putative ABC transport system permease protein
MSRGPEVSRKSGVTPPGVARWILERLIGEGTDEVTALEELYRERLLRDGRSSARRWYWRQVLGFGVRWRGLGREHPSMAIGTWVRELRLAMRSLRRTPVFTGVAVITLSLGIGADTAMFSVIRGSLLRPLPYADPTRLVWLSDGHPDFGGPGANESVPNLMDLRTGSRLLESSAMYRLLGANLATADRAERVQVLYASSELLRVLGLRPQVGRDLDATDDDANAETVALLSERIWRSHYGGAVSAVGQVTTVDARPVRIVGILPSGFEFPGDPDLLLPLQHVGAELNRGSRGYFGIGRLAAGADVPGLRAELQSIFARLVETYPDANEGWYTWAQPLRDYVVGRDERSLLVLGGAVLLVLLIACVNVTNLLLVRAETRRRELAVRYSLGARRSGLLAMFLSEGLVLSAAGGILGVLTAYWGSDLLVSIWGGFLARSDGIRIDLGVLGFAFGTTLVVGLLVGSVPVLRMRQGELVGYLKEGDRGSSGRDGLTGRALVITEIALALLVVAGTALLANSMWRLQRRELGVSSTERVMTFTMSLPAASYPDATRIGLLVDELESKLRAIPGVEAVGFVNRLPLLGGDNTTVSAYGEPDREANFVSVRFVTRGYLEATGARLLAGRRLEEADFDGRSTSALINATLARQLFGDADPLGRRIDTHFAEGGITVAGVIGDIAGGRVDEPAPAAFYLPLPTVLRLWASRPRRSGDYWGLSALVKTSGDPGFMAPALRAAVAELDRQLPINQLRTLAEIAANRLGTRRFALSLFGVFAGLALILGAVGIYGVMSYGVARRSRELGMRMALGASRGSVQRMVLGQCVRLTVPGVAIGVALALAFAGVLRGLLYEVSPLDPWTYLCVATILALVSLVAAWLPARRASRVDPLVSLRDA